ncbi:flagellar hook-basal body complex protein FliE [Desulfobotulus sp.]|jgi:flagellar hook-basal body complex protein FliE|uniref:flagellar hook-basal body complex protein FliE n=1 Tax=Desulfobotulus sp. TaxID=1940337 RepID=UPI002A36054C|nr:flagellar hook-basal body complex protein FliE [Desulfobotulus sp.]MDY0163376.1 flagellar hook-basal body complex protein FliE [Desulfobotulus sp.]
MDSLRAPFFPLPTPGSGQAKVQTATPEFSGRSFADRLNGAVREVNTLQKTSDLAAEKVMLGELDLHEGMMALQEADLSMRLLVQVRSKALEAYKEIMHMQF